MVKAIKRKLFQILSFCASNRQHFLYAWTLNCEHFREIISGEVIPAYNRVIIQQPSQQQSPPLRLHKSQ